jgi:hypothetical protein
MASLASRGGQLKTIIRRLLETCGVHAEGRSLRVALFVQKRYFQLAIGYRLKMRSRIPLLLASLAVLAGLSSVTDARSAGEVKRQAPQFACTYDEATGVATVTGSGSALRVSLNGDQIRFTWDRAPAGIYQPPEPVDVGCQSTSGAAVIATLSNTDAVELDVAADVSLSLWVHQRPGPGRTPEPETSEVETYLGPDVLTTTISLERADYQQIALGSLGPDAGIDLDVNDEDPSSADADVIFRGPFLPRPSTPIDIEASHGTGPISLSAAGGEAFDGPLPTTLKVASPNADDELVAGTEPVYFNAGAGHNTLVGSPQDDDLISSGQSKISAGAGDDWLVSGDGDADLDGGPGTDEAGFVTWDPPDSSTRGVRIDLGVVGAQNMGFGFHANLGSVEQLVGSNYDDRLVGSAGSDRLRGFGGDDRLLGGGGDDRIVGDDGNDRLRGGRGADSLSGNRGSDRLNARDGVRDQRIACGPDTDARDRALVDSLDPHPRSC